MKGVTSASIDVVNVSAADQNWGSGRSCHCVSSCCYGSEGLDPELSLGIGAIGGFRVPLGAVPHR